MATVLIADSERERGKRLAEACAARGLGTLSAEHGAAALELALSERPEVVVAPLDLPLIDAAKLLDILRANPRTRGVHAVLLGTRLPGQPGTDVRDEVLEEHTDPAEVSRRVEGLLSRRAELDEVEQEVEDDHDVEGKLSKIALADLLQLFHVNGKTGTLKLVRRGDDAREEVAQIYLDAGNLVQATCGNVDGEKALYRVLGWREGAFAFQPRPSTVVPTIHTPLRALLLEGMRQLDETARLEGELPALDAHVALRVKSGELPNMVHPLTQEVLLLLEIYTRVRDVVDHCSFPDYQVLRTLRTLVERGMVEIRAGRAPIAAPGSDGLFAPAQARRLRDWLDVARGRGRGPRDAKLLVLSASAGATADFVRLLRGLAGARVEGSFAGGSFSPDDLAPLGRIPVDEDVGLELVHVPVGQAFAPLWRVAAHGALGTLTLLEGSVEAANAAVDGPLGVLREMPRSRIFHVLLLRKDERALPEELRENLQLIDDASLFLVALESGKEPAAVLRSLFNRVLP